MIVQDIPATNLILKNVSSDLKAIGEKVLRGERISFDEGVLLYKKGELSFLGVLANFVREKKTEIMFTSTIIFIWNLLTSACTPAPFVLTPG